MSTSLRTLLLGLLASTALAKSFLPWDSQDISNAYSVRVRVKTVTTTQPTDLYLKFFGSNDVFKPSDSLGLTYDFSDNVEVGTFKKPDNSSNIGFSLFSTGNNELILSYNLASEIYRFFPNTSSFDSVSLWPNVSVATSIAENDIAMLCAIDYVGVLDVFGDDIEWPLWKVAAVYVGAKAGLALVLAGIDFSRQPLQLASGSSKFGIFAGNALWVFFGGLETGLVYLLLGVLLCLTIILSPFGVKLVRYAVFSTFPFGREIRTNESSGDVCDCLGNLIWLIFLGIPLVLLHVIWGVALCLLIVTIPFGLQHFKLAKFALMPFGHTPVFREDLAYGETYERVYIVQEAGPRYV